MRLVAIHPDPNGGRYMFERFRCAGCGVEAPYVRPVAAPGNAAVPPLGLFSRNRKRAPAITADGSGPSRFG
jgi:hypothetical protein